MKILFIHGIAEVGGAERELLLIVNHLPKYDCQPVVVCPREGPFPELLRHGCIETRSAPFYPWRKFLWIHRRSQNVKGLMKVLQIEKPDLVHVNDIWWVPQTLRALKYTEKQRIPVVVHVRQEIECSKVKRYELDKSSLVFAVSCRVSEALVAGGVPGQRLRVLYSGLDLTKTSNRDVGQEGHRPFDIPPEAPLIGTVANLFPRKGYEVMLAAFPKVLEVIPNVHYLIIGKGNEQYEKSLKSRVNELGLGNQIHFTGFQSMVYSYLACLDVYVHPALMEGFGISVLESMAMEKPVIATKTGGLPEIVEDGRTGILVPPGNSTALARAIVDLLQDSKQRAEMGRLGKKRVTECFTVESMMGKMVQEYNLLISNLKN